MSAAPHPGGPGPDAATLGGGGSGGAVGHALRRLSFYIKRARSFYGLWSILVLGYVACFVYFPLLVGRTVAAAFEGAPREEIIRLAFGLAALALIRGVLRYFSRALVFNAAREIEYEIRNDLFAHLQRLPQSFYFSWRTGDLMSRCVNDLNSVRMLLGPALLSVIQTPVLFVGVIIAMLTMNPLLTLLVLLPYPAFFFVARAFGSAMHSRSIAVQEGLAEMSNKVQEGVAGIGVVKAYAMEGRQEDWFDETADELYRRQLRMVWVAGGMPSITMMLPGFAMLMVLVAGGSMMQNGTLGLEQFFAFTMYIYELTFPTFIMGWVVALVQRGAAAMQRLDEILSIEPSIANREDTVELDSLSGAIEFRHLTFSYGDDARAPALRDLSLEVPAGSTLGIVGPVGSGKTTLASVIPRLYEVEDGEVFLDGVDINRIPLETLRAGIAMVPQDSFLFSMSLADNIAYGLPGMDRAAVEQAATRARLSQDVDELPAGFETLVGERGVMLSGGQRQRTALARALALRPSILILDDTLSAVDAETEAEIQRSLREVFDGRTVVVVANRVSSVQDCDQIVVLSEGALVEKGTHAELLAAGRLYSRLAREQSSDEARQARARELAEIEEVA